MLSRDCREISLNYLQFSKARPSSFDIQSLSPVVTFFRIKFVMQYPRHSGHVKVRQRRKKPEETMRPSTRARERQVDFVRESESRRADTGAVSSGSG